MRSLEVGLRHRISALAALGLLATAAPALATSPRVANGDFPYWKLNYSRYDTTYAAIDAQARRYPEFRWDATLYCRYRTGWQGPGAYHLGDRFRVHQGWDGGYPWQGAGVPADHDDDSSMAFYRANYARIYGHEPVCGPVRRHHRRRHEVVLRRKD